MHHAIAVGKELCLGFVWGMFIVFFQISTVIIYEYTDIPAFKFFAALHPYNLSVMIRVEPFARPRSYCCRYDEQLAAEKQRTERVTKRMIRRAMRLLPFSPTALENVFIYWAFCRFLLQSCCFFICHGTGQSGINVCSVQEIRL